MQAYLFVHFREKTTPDGEQVYFGVSKDGFNWEEVNGGAPVLWAYYGDKGVRDFTVVRCKNPQTGKEKFVILATDLSLSYGMRGQYHHSWDEIGHNGSKSLAIWESDDLVNWTEQRLAKIGDEQFGCLWAPDVIYDKKAEAGQQANDFCPAEGVFIAMGTAGSTEIARQMGAELTEKGNIKVNENMETTIPGLYAAGDCTGGLLQVAKAVYEGAQAGINAGKYVRSLK